MMDWIIIIKIMNRLIREQSRKFSSSHFRSIEDIGIRHHNVLRNVCTSQLYEICSKPSQLPYDYNTQKSVIASNGALCAFSGKRTGRSPLDKRIVIDHNTQSEVWWGDINIPQKETVYDLLEDVTINYLNSRREIFLIDGYAGYDPEYRMKFRILTTRAYHAIFMSNMLIKPTEQELKEDFDEKGVDFHIMNAGDFPCPSSVLLEGVNPDSKCNVSVNLGQKRMIILGTQYAGEMKKGVFGIMHYIMPQKGVLTMHCSANEGIQNGDTTLLFGLSGTGKTTLSADPHRRLIGDDEHCWSDKGIFNIEGGCYAKTVNLNRQKEPEIYDAIKFGAILENVGFKGSSRDVDYTDTSITENTRVSYPLEHIPNVKIPAIGGHPKNVIFLTCDSFGVLPPVAKLDSAQSMYHFIAGYTAKVAGTEMGINEPVSTFSACFGAAFLPRHPTVYAEMLADKIKQNGSHVWLINTGWSGGQYG